MNIAIVTNKSFNKCETFIKAQINNLPYNIVHYWGFKLPFQLVEKQYFIHKVLRRIKIIKTNKFALLENDLKKQNIQLVLAQYGMMGVEVFDVCKTLNLPLIVHFHGHDAVRYSILETYGEAYKKLFMYRKLKVIAVSKVMEQQLIELGCPADKIVYNPYGPQEEFTKLNCKFTKPQFIGLGRFVDKKAPHLTILAFSEVLKYHPRATLILAGDGVLLDSCKDLSRALNVESKVFFPGYITPEKYQQYLIESIAFVQHSIKAQDGDMEGTPVSIIEASGAGIPVISTIHAGIPDVIVDNETGLLCNESDINKMAKNMCWVLENKQEALAMGAKGKERISTFFSLERYINTLTNVIESTSKKVL